MARFLALQWDSYQARLAVAQARGDQVTIEHAFSVDLGPHESGEPLAEANIALRISEALAERGISKVETLVAVGRAGIELKHLSLPPAPEDELPEMVRFQASRQFHRLDDDWALDYVPIGSPSHAHGDSSGMEVEVIAAAISPELVEQITQTCEAAHLNPRRLVLRPCASASLLRRHRFPGGKRVRLLLDPLSDEMDLTVLVDQDVVFLRTVRVSGEAIFQTQSALLMELRRTIAAVENQLGNQRVEEIYVCGDEPELAELTETIRAELNLPASLFDPFDDLDLSAQLHQEMPRHHGRFAPLLGMLLDEAEGTGHALDFLNPRKKPESPRQSKKLLAGGLGAAAVLVALAWLVWLPIRKLDNQITSLKEEVKKLDKDIESYQPDRQRIDKIKLWTSGDIIWLDELADLCRSFVPAKEAMVTKMTFNAHRKGGQIQLQGLATSDQTVLDLENRLRQAEHRSVTSQGLTEDTQHKSKSYPQWFAPKISVQQRPRDYYLQRLGPLASDSQSSDRPANVRKASTQ